MSDEEQKLEYVWTIDFGWQSMGDTSLAPIYIDVVMCSACDQEAMWDSFMCADCRTVAEEVQQDHEPAPSDLRPADSLRDWITRPCGTITDKRSQ